MQIIERGSLTICHDYQNNRTTFQNSKLDFRVIVSRSYIQLNLPMEQGKPVKAAMNAVNRIAKKSQLQFTLSMKSDCYHVASMHINDDFTLGIGFPR